MCGFVRPATGPTWWMLPPTVSSEAMSEAFRQVVRDEGIGAGKWVTLVPDNAGWHHSIRVAKPEVVEFAFLPAHSPELQPAEWLWPLINDPVANRELRDLPDLPAVPSACCR